MRWQGLGWLIDDHRIRQPWGITVLAIICCSLSGVSIAAPETSPSPSALRQVLAPKKPAPSPAAESLLDPKTFPKGWLHHTAQKNAPLAGTWKIDASDSKAPVLICVGKPAGYLRTVKIYENFELRLEWKYPRNPNGNSGVLIHTSGEDKIWPRSIQVQLHGPVAGSIFPSGGAQSDNKVEAKGLSRGVNEWNTCVITSKNGTISVEINGRKAGTLTGCNPKKGCIALQSEGSEVHFRNMQIRVLK